MGTRETLLRVIRQSRWASNRMKSVTAPKAHWIEGRDYVLATPAIRERLKYVINPEVFRDKWLSWDEPNQVIARKQEIKSLRLMTTSDERPPFPECVYAIEALRHIGMAVEYSEVEHPRSWCERLESLDLNEREGGSSCLPRSVCFSRIHALSCVTSMLGFHSDAFPSLRSLKLNISRKRSVRQEIGSTNIQEVYFAGLRSFDDIRLPHNEAVLSLGVGRCQSEELAGIGRFRSVRRLIVKDLPKLVSLDFITELPDLEVLEVMYCPRIQSDEPLIEHPRLTQVLVVSCKRLMLKRWKAKAAQPCNGAYR